eukprot:5824128-Alexandrium_andersonii.AAC.1
MCIRDRSTTTAQAVRVRVRRRASSKRSDGSDGSAWSCVARCRDAQQLPQGQLSTQKQLTYRPALVERQGV